MDNASKQGRIGRCWFWCLQQMRRGRAWAWVNLPWGVRSIVGLALIALGVVGIVLPLIGPWMIPVGAAIVFLDVRPLYIKWRAKQREEREAAERSSAAR